MTRKRLLLLSIVLPGLVKTRDKRGKTIDSFETIFSYVCFCFAALFAYPQVCLFKYVFLKNDIYVPQQR